MSLFVDIQKKSGNFTLRVSFETKDGTLGMLGPSGSGKSMTLKCIAGIEKPDSGRIILNGITLFDSEKKINLPPQKRHVGYLFQNYALFPNMNVRQNILCGLKNEKDAVEKQKIYAETLKLLHLEGLENHKPHQLSGGQAQRTALARILVSRPEVLLLDEPFSALDAHLRLKLQIELKELLSFYGKEVLLVSHSRDEIYRMCDSTMVIADGTVLAMNQTKALFDDPGCVEAASITGCKNIIPAVKSGEYEVTVPQWGNLRFTTAQPVKEHLKAIGIRAHAWNTDTQVNRHTVRFIQEMEEPFEKILLFKFSGQSQDTENIWWRVSKEQSPEVFPAELGISPEHILLL